MSLRLRLLISLILLVAIGLSAIDTVTYLALQSSLTQQIDSQLTSSADSVYACLVRELETANPRCFNVYGIPAGSFAELAPQSGAAPSIRAHFEKSGPNPAIPATLIRSAGARAVETTVGVLSGPGEYRLLVVEAPTPPPGSDLPPSALVPSALVVAFPLSSLDATLSELRTVEALVSAAIVLLLGIVAWWTVQLGLSPLRRIRDTAQKIAAGDLGQRVENVDPRTEVGQLGVSLNEMLAQIEQAFEARSASEERLRQFVADASHELRTPLSSIRGYAELFRLGAAGNPEDLSKSMNRIESEAIRMGQLVDDLLLLARLDEGRPLEIQPVDLAQLSLDCAADQSAADRSHPITVAAPHPTVVAGDEARLRQVITNLVRNGVVHTPSGTHIEILVRDEPDLGVVEVVDHGPGVPADAQDRIFERFVRADRSRGRARGGAGLGLAIVAAIVASHRGRIRHLPTPGGGATFRVELPKRQTGPTPDPSVVPRAAALAQQHGGDERPAESAASQAR